MDCMATRCKTRRRQLSPLKRTDSVAGLALLVTGRVPQEPELLDLWKAAWDRLIWKAMISKVKAIERELNRNPPGFIQGRSQHPSPI